MSNSYLRHYGILAMKWGVRRFQNKDGTRTPQGKVRQRLSTQKSPMVKATMSAAEERKLIDEYSTSLNSGRVANTANEISWKESDNAINKNMSKQDLDFVNNIRDTYFQYDPVSASDLKRHNDIYKKAVEGASKELQQRPVLSPKGNFQLNVRYYEAFEAEGMPKIGFKEPYWEPRKIKHAGIQTAGGYLQHYGILGMKWGVRRERGPDGKVLKIGDPKNLSNKKTIVKAGETCYRISRSKNEVDTGITFVFTNKDDAMKFGNQMAKVYGDKQFLLEMKVKENLISPSERERVETFLDGYKNLELKNLIDDISKQERVKDPDGDPLLEKYRAYSIAVSRNPVVQRAVGTLGLQKGYNSIVDDFMRGYPKLGPTDKNPMDSADSAMIVFTRSSSLETTSTTSLRSINREAKKRRER